MNYGAINESIVDDRAVHIEHRGVICETPAAPFSADEADAAVTESVIHAAVEPDVRSPVTAMPAVNAAGEAPVAGSPENAGARRRDPNAGNPVIAGVTVRPITGSPKIAFGGAGRGSSRTGDKNKTGRETRATKEGGGEAVGWGGGGGVRGSRGGGEGSRP